MKGCWWRSEENEEDEEESERFLSNEESDEWLWVEVEGQFGFEEWVWEVKGERVSEWVMNETWEGMV